MQQAAACGRLLAEFARVARDGVVLSSPLRRARSTAEAIAAEVGGRVVLDDRLVELDYGELDGLPVGGIDADTWSSWRSDASFRPPGGESLLEVQERVARFCSEYTPAAADVDVICVSHVSPIKAAACWALGAEAHLTWRMSLPVASLTRVTTEPRALRSFGETGHLLRDGLCVEPFRAARPG